MNYEQLTTQDRILALTGGHTSDIDEALDQWQNERQALNQFHAENQAIQQVNRQMKYALDLAHKLAQLIEEGSPLFLTTQVRNKLAQFNEQYNKLTEA